MPHAEPFAAKYTTAQREALFQAAIDREVAPYARVALMAKQGELTYDGEPVAPFTISGSYLGEILRTEKRRRAGRPARSTAQSKDRAGVDAIRDRLLAATSLQLEKLEKRAKSAKQDVSGEELRQVARAIREVYALYPATGGGPLPDTPGGHDPQTGKRIETQGGMAGQLLADARAEGRQTAQHAHTAASKPQADPLPDAPTTTSAAQTPQTQEPSAQRSTTTQEREDKNTSDGGSVAGARFGALRV